MNLLLNKSTFYRYNCNYEASIILFYSIFDSIPENNYIIKRKEKLGIPRTIYKTAIAKIYGNCRRLQCK